MTRYFALRLGLDLLAVLLMIAALAYWGFGNLAHEVIGTALFALIALHGRFNRRWYAALFRGRYDTRRRAMVAVNAAFAATMAVLLATSVMISRDVFAFLGIEAGFRLREIHLFAAYWSTAILGLHLGLNWPKLTNMVRSILGLRGHSSLRIWVLRSLAALIAVQGVLASGEMGFGAKLSLTMALDMWDFTSRTPRFFLNYGAIIGLYAVIAHTAMALLRRRKSPASA